MRLPDVQAELRELAIAHSMPRLAELAEEMYRRKRAVKTKPESKKMTREIKNLIRQLHKDHPDWSHQEIAYAAGVNSARVSETLFGKRT